MIEFDRIWAMPNHLTFKIKPISDLLKFEVLSGKWIDPFSNDSYIKKISHAEIVTNDINPACNSDHHLDAVDFLKLFEDSSLDGVLYDPPYCYDKETQLFTKDGWKYFEELTEKDIVATLNVKTNMLEYQKPEEIIKKKYKGEMICINSQSINLLVTPNHKMWVKNNFYGNYSFVDANELLNKTKVWFQKTCDYESKEKEYFYLPKVELKKPNRYGEKVKLEKPINMDLWLKFLGLFLSEGCAFTIREKDRKHNYRIGIAQKKENIRKIVIEVLNELGYKYTTSPCEFRLQDKQLWTYLWELGKTKEKYIPEEYKNLSKRQIKILLDYMMLGDGTNIKYPKLNKKVNKMYHYTTNVYFTSSKKLMNDFSELAIKIGRGITIREDFKGNYDPVYSIHMLGASHFRVYNKNITKVDDFDDFVYCVSVPNKIVLIKRQGRTCWCGNSTRQVSECYKSFGHEVTQETTRADWWTKNKAEIARIVKPGGKVISFGWNSGGIGKTLGFEIVRIMLVPHGGIHNDTIVTIEKKL